MSEYTINDRNGDTRIEGTIDPDPAFNGGTITEGLTVADTDPAETQLLVALPTGTSALGTNVLAVRGEPGSGIAVLNLDAYGALTLHADTVDVTNGGGALVLEDHAGAVQFGLVADDGNGTPIAGFFGAARVARPTVTGAKLPSDTVMASLLTALAALGLITDSTT